MRKVSQIRTASGQTAANKLNSPLYTQAHYTKIINQKPRPQVKATSDWSQNPGDTHASMIGNRMKVHYTDGTIKYMTPEDYTIARSEEFLSNPFE